jgi:L-ascorbate metabolism protein UlaG (beta-lactamase superfamily)
MPPPPPPGDASGARLTWVGHATVLLELGGRRLLTDPLLRARVGPLARASAGADPAVARGLDAVLVSHLHPDHLDARSLRRIDRATPVIAPRGAGSLVRRLGFADVTELGIGETVDVGGVGVRAVPAHHDGRRLPFGARADTIGFVVGADRRVYFAGDTELFEGMAEVDDALDVALLPIAGWGPTLGPGHLGPREAAVALTRLRPRVAVPIHWGTLYPLGLRFRRHRVLADPPREFARYAAELAPDVDVRVLAPGEALSLDEPRRS